MTLSRKLAAALAGVLALGAAARAADEVAVADNNPYTAIGIRNVFSLNPPTPVVQQQPEAPVKITANGIMTIFGVEQVLFKASGGPLKTEQSYILSEGQRQDDIEVLKIDEAKGTVKFNNHGIVQDLALANGTATGGTTVGAGTNPSFPNAGFAGRGPGRFNFPVRSPAPGVHSGNSGGSAENGGEPAFNSANGSTQTYQPPRSNLTPEEQVLMIEAQRAYYQAKGNPMAKILPPTSMTPQVTGEGSAPGPGGPGAP
ncbi:MAG TPA: hypothetical protein VFV81_02080 [Verrucomicrobiae bacterium]|nr:hypothetical protein [Verrucomicrobiae bacterium]